MPGLHFGGLARGYAKLRVQLILLSDVADRTARMQLLADIDFHCLHDAVDARHDSQVGGLVAGPIERALELGDA